VAARRRRQPAELAGGVDETDHAERLGSVADVPRVGLGDKEFLDYFANKLGITGDYREQVRRELACGDVLLGRAASEVSVDGYGAGDVSGSRCGAQSIAAAHHNQDFPVQLSMLCSSDHVCLCRRHHQWHVQGCMQHFDSGS
jgi:hypothetical protein